MTDRETIDVYDEKASDYVALSADLSKGDTRLAAFIAACGPDGRVLDLGCGPGHYAAEMAKAGLAVDATDASAEMVRLANAFPGVTARQATFDDLDGSEIYDGVWANFSLLHAPRDAMPRHLSSIRQALKPGGRFCIGVKMGEGEARDTLGRLYTYYGEDELVQLLSDAGLTVTERHFGQGEGLDGSLANWIMLTAHA